MIREQTQDILEAQMAGRDYWTLRHDQASTKFRQATSPELAAVYLKLADHYLSLATICGVSGRKSVIVRTDGEKSL